MRGLCRYIIFADQTTRRPAFGGLSFFRRYHVTTMATSDPHRTTVLIVDDHRLFRAGVRAVLEEYPEIVIVGEATNGLEAVNHARAFRPRVIVMDVDMPYMDGIQATRLIKQELQHTTIIGLSVNESRTIRDALLEAGAVTYLQKNDVDIDLYRCIQQSLGGQLSAS